MQARDGRQTIACRTEGVCTPRSRPYSCLGLSGHPKLAVSGSAPPPFAASASGLEQGDRSVHNDADAGVVRGLRCTGIQLGDLGPAEDLEGRQRPEVAGWLALALLPFLLAVGFSPWPMRPDRSLEFRSARGSEGAGGLYDRLVRRQSEACVRRRSSGSGSLVRTGRKCSNCRIARLHAFGDLGQGLRSQAAGAGMRLLISCLDGEVPDLRSFGAPIRDRTAWDWASPLR